MNNTKIIRVCLLAVLAVLAGVNQGVAQSTAFTYQGQITDNGTNFTGMGQFEFALQVVTNTSSQAIVGIQSLSGLASGSVDSCVVYYGGYGYTTPPVVTFSGGNPDATGTAVVNNGVVTGINITSGGYYSYEAFVSVAPPPENNINFTIWNSDGTTGSQPMFAVNAGVTNGLFTVQVGNSALPNMTAIPEAIFLQTNLLLQIWFNDGVHGWAALNPAQPLTASPYATFANLAGTLTGTLPTSQLTGAVPTSQLSGSLPTSQLIGSLPAASLTGSVPSAALTSVPAGSLTGSVPSAALTSVPAASLTGTLTSSVLPSPLAPPGVINFGGTLGVTEQMLNLYGTGYGIGVQANTEYFRTASGYAWFKGGSHNDGQNNSGGGSTLMTLDGSGNLECAGTVYSKGQALTSDRNLKENFQRVDNQAVLAKVAALPVTEWNYKSDSQAVQHIGPMAQDFQAAFGLDGKDDKHISVVDEGGVALAAIQGLNAKVEAKDAEIQALEQKLAALQAVVERMAEKR